MYRGEVPGCCYQKTLLRFRAYGGVLPEFALCVFRSYLHSGRFRRSANITTSIAHLAAERFVRIEFPIPPLKEQRQIVDAVVRRLEALRRIEADLKKMQATVASLRHSVLKAGFSGSLVEQDPVDEPALALLERIGTDRDGKNGATRRGRKRNTA
jgi:type I restriction enzyme S subunit